MQIDSTSPIYEAQIQMRKWMAQVVVNDKVVTF